MDPDADGGAAVVRCQDVEAAGAAASCWDQAG
jgi:hypothetical protein